jgi:gliding motility-associated-like protein
VSNICIEDIYSDTALIRPSPNAEYTPSVVVAEINETVIFTPNVFNASLYEWVFQPGATGAGRTGLHTYTQAGDYLSFLIATNEFNCSDSFAVPIHVTRNQLIYVPNVFSPNAQNADNQVMRIYGTNIAATGFEILIYNRWGTKVFESTDLTEMKTNGWDGKLRNGADLPNGVYTYYIKGQFFDGESFQQVGTVSLIK